jgi:ribosome-associated heat shock protein Hsp15
MDSGIATVRIDKWLWAARFYKTRGLATVAVGGGKVHVNGERAKPAKLIRVGDELEIRLGPYLHAVKVMGLSERRGPAAAAVRLYLESEESRRAREALALQLKYSSSLERLEEGRPTKRERRDLLRLKRRQ